MAAQIPIALFGLNLYHPSMRKPIIAFLCASPAWGGLEMNVLRLTNWMCQRGWEIILYAVADSVLWQKAKDSGISLRHIKSTFKHGDIVNAHRLEQYIAADNIDILVLHERRHIMLASLAKLGVGRNLKLVYIQHMHIGVNKKDLYHTWLFSNLDAWVVPLQILKDRLLSKTNFDSAKIAVVPFGIELDRFATSLTSKAESRRELGLPVEGTLIGMVGRLEPEKCQETLIKAAILLHEQNRPVHVLIVGNETLHEERGYRDYLQKLADGSNIKNYTHFLPATDNVASVYAALDIFALTSKSETYGMVTIEALASGLPVIGTRHGGTREIVQDGINGLLIERQRPEELAAAIVTLLDNPELISRFSSRARADSENYSHEVQCALMADLFRKLIGKPDDSV
jgi:D-inositol-3-phosphate glycosyltransferase